MTIDKAQVARQFSRAALHYDDFAIVQKEMADRLLTSIPDGATGDLIDLGCGTGLALQHIQHRTDLTLTGVDIAAKMLKIAKARVPNANFIVRDLEQTGLKKHAFDYVFSNAAIQWCDLENALNEMFRLLRPGGQLLLASFGDGTLQQWEDAWLAVNPAHQRVHKFPHADVLKNALRQAGFSSIEIVSTRRTFTFDSIEQMITSIRKIGATFADRDRAKTKLTRKTYQRFREAVANTPSGLAQLSYNCLAATANV